LPLEKVASATVYSDGMVVSPTTLPLSSKTLTTLPSTVALRMSLPSVPVLFAKILEPPEEGGGGGGGPPDFPSRIFLASSLNQESDGGPAGVWAMDQT
jgi:hypothetical protein